MIANIGPANWNFDETLSSLRYANRAKNIQNKPRINEDPKDAMLREFQVKLSLVGKDSHVIAASFWVRLVVSTSRQTLATFLRIRGFHAVSWFPTVILPRLSGWELNWQLCDRRKYLS